VYARACECVRVCVCMCERERDIRICSNLKKQITWPTHHPPQLHYFIFIVRMCILLRVYQITRQNLRSQQINKRALFRALYGHNMFRASQKAIFR
jgi:hypothetical protein